MAVHVTIYPEEDAAAALRTFMASHDCSAPKAVELLLAQTLPTGVLARITDVPAPAAVAASLGVA